MAKILLVQFLRVIPAVLNHGSAEWLVTLSAKFTSPVMKAEVSPHCGSSKSLLLIIKMQHNKIRCAILLYRVTFMEDWISSSMTNFSLNSLNLQTLCCLNGCIVSWNLHFLFIPLSRDTSSWYRILIRYGIAEQRSTSSQGRVNTVVGCYVIETRTNLLPGLGPHLPSHFPPHSWNHLGVYYWTSPMVQRLRIYLSMQGTQVRSLVQEYSTCCEVTKPACPNDWSLCTLEPMLCNERSHCNEKSAQLN